MLRRGLPIGSLDMGMTFERETTRGRRAWIQTLEPRLLYVRVPFEDQSTLPVFDTILPDFNLIQLFRKYQFVGPGPHRGHGSVQLRRHDAAHRRGERPRAPHGNFGPDALSKPAARDAARHAADGHRRLGLRGRSRHRHPRRVGARLRLPMEQRNVLHGAHRNALRVPPEGRSAVRLRLSLPARFARARRPVARLARSRSAGASSAATATRSSTRSGSRTSSAGSTRPVAGGCAWSTATT